ncbi:MAG: hypothetical protein QM754_18180 [Tepidisphaeraceae bacterium]
MLLTTNDLLRLCGIRNRQTIHAQVRKGHLNGHKRSRVDGGLSEWVFDEAEAQRFAEWYKSTPRLQR